MVKKKAIDKKKKKQQNEVFKNAVDDFDRFEDFFASNLKNIIIAFAVISVVLVIGAIVYMQINKEKMRISGELTSANTIDELKSKIEKYSDNESVHSARLRLATMYFNEGKFMEAQSEYIAITVDAPAGEIKNLARLNEAYVMEALKKPFEAADRFVVIGQDLSVPEYIRNEANFSAGRIYFSAKKMDKAKGCLKSIDFNNPGFWAAQGEKLLQSIN